MTAVALGGEPITFKPSTQFRPVNYEPAATETVIIGDRKQLRVLDEEIGVTLHAPVAFARSQSVSTPHFNIGAVVFLLLVVVLGSVDLAVGHYAVSGTVLGMLAFAAVWLWLTGVIAHRNRGRGVA